jgi:DNA-binding SARP family transcriptional activator
MEGLRLHILGTPELRDGDRLLTFRSRKALALLVYLAVENRPVSRDEIAALLWPDTEPARARGLLRSTLNYVRQAFRAVERDAAIVLITEGTLLRVDRTALTLDVASIAETLAATHGTLTEWDTARQGDALQQLQQTVAAYRGEALAGFALPDAPEFETWASVQREHWHQQGSLVFERLTQVYETGGNLAAARDAAAQWIAHDRLNEVAYRRLIQLQAALGERTAALHAYDTYADLLAAELHAAPAADLTALAERLRAETPPAHAASQRTRAPDPTASFEVPFVGRADEYAHLMQCYQAATQGQAHLVIIDGKAGMGKTRLAEQVVGRVQAQGADVLVGRAFDTGQLAYGALVEAIRPRLERERALDDLLGDVWLTELSRLLPELRERLTDLPPALPDEPTARARLFESLARLGEALTMHAPVVLFIDDAQWADSASRDALLYAARQWAAQDIPILVLLTMRHEDMMTTPALSGWLTMLGRVIPTTTISVDFLTRADMRQLVLRLDSTTDAATADELTTRIARATGGFPLAIAELLTVLRIQGLLLPPGQNNDDWSLDTRAAQASVSDLHPLLLERLRDEVQRRYHWIAPDTRTLLGAAAVLGSRASFAVLVRVAGLDDEAGLAALDEALRQRVLVEQEAGPYQEPTYMFRHDNIRDIIYTLLGAARRRVTHRRALEVLRDTNAPAAALARHAQQAGDVAAALTSLVAAGDAALEVHALHEALDHYEAARQIIAALPTAPPPADRALLEQLQRNHQRAAEGLRQADEP